jgi:exodeoxyribonuclease VII small subunit
VTAGNRQPWIEDTGEPFNVPPQFILIMKSKPSTKKKEDSPGSNNFEQSLKRLEDIVETLEQGKVTLDETMKMYEEGVQISKSCLEHLSQAEIKLKRLTKDVEGNFELFDENESDE